jgi:hypothetical protein
MTRASTLCSCFAILVIGCGAPAGRNGGGGNGGTGGGGSGGNTGIEDLVVTPANVTLDIVDGMPLPSQDYKVHDAGGNDVTGDCTIVVEDPLLGSFSGATFSASGMGAGVSHVRATKGDHFGRTPLTVHLKKIVIAPGAPPDAPGKFGGAPTGPAPAMVYPPDGTLIPPNLSELEVQFTPPAGTSLYEVGFVAPALELKIYTTCNAVGGGCALLPDEDTWKLLSHASASTTVALSLRSTDGNGGPVGSAPAQKLSFADADLQGGLYYWAAASGSILRYDFGLRNQTAEQFYTAAKAGSTCVGCHVLSRNGARIAVGMNVPGPAELRTLDVATRATLFDSGGGGGGGLPGGGIPGGSGSNFEALSPDGTQALINSGANLALIDTGNGMSLAAGAIMNATMPDWSADGARIVFVRDSSSACPLGLCGAQPGVSMGTLMMTNVSGTMFSGESTLVSGGGNNYYPSLSPDGAWVAFNRSAMNSYDAPDAKVLVVPTAGGAPVDLTAVNATAGNSWPKFAPFAQTFQGKPIYWLTFSSRRDYGLRLQQAGKTQDMQTAQLWMVAVSPDRAAAGDGGYPAFWLPFQDMTTGNHIAQWTEKVERAPCTQIDLSQCMPNETCIDNFCTPAPIQ